eukprot:34007-Eustigmatos_ZCMA.PRE.1
MKGVTQAVKKEVRCTSSSGTLSTIPAIGVDTPQWWVVALHYRLSYRQCEIMCHPSTGRSCTQRNIDHHGAYGSWLTEYRLNDSRSATDYERTWRYWL